MIEVALRLYTEGKVRKSRAVEITGLSVGEMTDLIAQRGVRWNYRADEAKQELAAVLVQAQHP